MLIAKNVPASMRALPNWIRWKTVKRNGDKPTKVPIQPTGPAASSTDPTTWTSFEEAEAYGHIGDGIGFVFPTERTMFGIDLDGCRDPETKKVAEWAREIILYLKSYSEVSPSLTGVKIFCLGRLPFDSGKKVSVQAERMTEEKEPGIEAYDHGRYFAVTGMTLAGMPDEPQERTEQVKYICDTYFKSKPVQTQPATATSQASSSGLSVIERARKYLDRLPASVSGQGGHGACFHAACVLVLGFELNQSEALVLLSEFNHRCQPPWSERELQHKIDSASKQGGERGYLRNARQDQWDGIKVPTYASKPDSKPEEAFRITTLQQAAHDYLDALVAGKMDLISTGIDVLDGALGGGICFGEYVLVGARPSHGKTAFAMQVLDACCEAGYKSAIISEEMGKLALGKRTLQFAVNTPEEHWKYETDGVRRLLNGHWDGRENCILVEAVRTADAAVNCTRWLVNEKGVRCIAIDYAQLLQAKGKSDTERVTEVSKAIRAVVNETQVAMFVLAQLSRDIEKRDRFIPKMSDLRQSGQLEQDADVVAFLVWPHRIDSKQPPKEFQIWIAKNRMRGVKEAMIECEFTPSRLRIAEAIQAIENHPNYHPEFEKAF